MTMDEINALMAKHPKLKQICDAKAQYFLAMTRLVLEKGKAEYQERLQEIEENLGYLRTAEERYCIENGIPLDYADVSPACPICQDRGWISYDSKTGVTEPCRCSLEKRHSRIFKLSGLSEAERSKTFDAFEFNYYSMAEEQERARKVHAKCRRFAMDIAIGKNVKMGIGVVGNVGRGKTHLLLSIFNYIAEASPRVFPVYCVAGDLLDELRAGYDEDADVSYNDRVKAIMDADLLIIDDLGAEKWTGWVESTFFKLVNGRLIKNKPIAFSTNLQMDDLRMVVGERIFSRLCATCEILELLGKEDIRMKRKFETLIEARASEFRSSGIG
jgi:DNA replication protein DnaC